MPYRHARRATTGAGSPVSAGRPVSVAGRGRDAGFTLVELLVVIGIIAVLISLLMPALTRARYHAQLTVCAARLQQFSVAMNIYAAQNRGAMPRFDVLPSGPPNLWDVGVGFYDEMRGRYQLPHEMFFCPLSQPDLPEYFWREPEPGGFYRFGYALWAPRKSSPAHFIPPSPGDGSGMTIMDLTGSGAPAPIAGPAKLGDPNANRNPVLSDVVLSNGTPPTPTSDLSRDRALGIYPFSQHLRNGVIESSHSAYADGHVERVNGGDLRPRFLSWNGYWNWR